MKGLRIARLTKGLTQTELANLIGLNKRQTIADWENGISTPSVDKLKKLSEILEVSMDYIVKGE